MIRILIVGAFIVISGHCRADLKPSMYPKENETFLNAGDELQIQCSSTTDRKLHFSYPVDNKEFGIVTSKWNISSIGGNYTFVRRNTTRGDAGWYACAEDGVEIHRETLHHNQSEIRWIYVWVESDTDYFVEQPLNSIIQSFIREKKIIPCRPTSRNTQVDLLVDQKSVNISEKGWSFDQKMGFIVNMSHLSENDVTFECEITKNGRTQKISNSLEVKRVPEFQKPTISDGPLIYVIRGEDLRVNCTTELLKTTLFKLSWIVPQQNPRIVPGPTVTKQLNERMRQHTTILTITNVIDQDDGNYTCRVSYKQYGNSTTTRIIVEAPLAPSVYRTNLNKSDFVVDPNKRNNSVSFECFVRGKPTPNITWYKNQEEIEFYDAHYKFFDERQKLTITEVRKTDAGNYLCRAENRVGRIEAHTRLVLTGEGPQTFWFYIIAAFFVIIVALIIYLGIKTHRERVLKKELMEAGLLYFEEGAVECLNRDLTVDDQAELLPYNQKWEFPRERLKIGKQLGSGAFGVVIKAEAQGISEDEAVTTVAVKMVRRTAEPTYIKALASELKVMTHLGKHLNVVNLLGACTKNIGKRELLVIVEYCRFGNLQNYLLRHRDSFINQIDPATGKIDLNLGIEHLTRSTSICSSDKSKYVGRPFSRSFSVNSGSSSDTVDPTSMDSEGVSMSPDGYVLSNNSVQPGWRSNYRGDYKDRNVQPICTADLLCWAFQVARGMEYLSFRKVLHGDLAARNILLAENNVVKICDFGLAKSMYKDDNYKKKGEGPLPIKWMAIESIRDRVFSTQSDIWSFGIVLWEFFTLAKTPYPGMEAEKQYQQLLEGYRMEQPEYATKELYDTILQCWESNPILRPSFTTLAEDIGNLLEESVKMRYIDLNTPYVDINTLMMNTEKQDYLMMMSAPNHVTLSCSENDYVNAPHLESVTESAYLRMSPTINTDDSGIFSPRPELEKSHFVFPSPTPVHSDSEDDTELDSMLCNQEPCVTTQNEVTNKRTRRDSGYCNAPRNVNLSDIDRTVTQGENETDSAPNYTDEKLARPHSKDSTSPTVITQDYHVNMPQQKSDYLKRTTESFSNPSYIIASKQNQRDIIVTE